MSVQDTVCIFFETPKGEKKALLDLHLRLGALCVGVCSRLWEMQLLHIPPLMNMATKHKF